METDDRDADGLTAIERRLDEAFKEANLWGAWIGYRQAVHELRNRITNLHDARQRTMEYNAKLYHQVRRLQTVSTFLFAFNLVLLALMVWKAVQ